MLDITNIPSEMITELALGHEIGHVVASRHGFNRATYDKLALMPWFMRAVSERKADLEARGFTFEAKMALMAEDLLTKTYRAAQATESLGLMLDVAKYLAKLGNLEPKPNAAAIGASGNFAINIIFPEPKAVTSPAPMIDVTPQHVETEDHDPLAAPPPFAMPGFNVNLNLDLRGGSVAE